MQTSWSVQLMPLFLLIADGHGFGDVAAHHCFWGNLPTELVPAQQLWDLVLSLLPVPAGHGLLCIPMLYPHPQGWQVSHSLGKAYS